MHEHSTVGFDIRTLANLIKRAVEGSETKQYVDGLTGMHGWVIGYLYAHQHMDVFQRDLEDEFRIRRSTATAMLQLMEKNGLIERQPVEQDARLKKLVLTPKAVAVHDMVDKDIKRIEDQLTKGITPEELATFHVVIEKMKNNIE